MWTEHHYPNTLSTVRTEASAGVVWEPLTAEVAGGTGIAKATGTVMQVDAAVAGVGQW